MYIYTRSVCMILSLYLKTYHFSTWLWGKGIPIGWVKNNKTKDFYTLAEGLSISTQTSVLAKYILYLPR